jgi:hypothetical protein
LKVRDPDRKGKVESGVAHAQKRTLKGKRFESLEEAQAYLDHGEEHRADTRIHGRTKRPVAAMFAEEKPSLQALPIKPFRYYQYGQQTVRLDGCVEVEAAYYGAPPGWIGRQVDVQWDAMFVRLLDPRTAMFCCASVKWPVLGDPGPKYLQVAQDHSSRLWAQKAAVQTLPRSEQRPNTQHTRLFSASKVKNLV